VKFKTLKPSYMSNETFTYFLKIDLPQLEQTMMDMQREIKDKKRQGYEISDEKLYLKDLKNIFNYKKSQLSKARYFHVRVRNPDKFMRRAFVVKKKGIEIGVPFLTKDIGRKGGMKAIIGFLHGRTSTSIQSYLLNKRDWKAVENTLVPITKRGEIQLTSLHKLNLEIIKKNGDYRMKRIKSN
jgi:hypothetical protein